MRIPVFTLGLLLIALPAVAAAGDGVLVPVRGILDAQSARDIAGRIEAAAETGAEAVVLDFDVDAAPVSGLALAERLPDLGNLVRVVAVVTGRAPGSAAAAVLACQKVYLTDGATLGPIPDRGPVTESVARALSTRAAPRNALMELYPRPDTSAGIDAATAETLRLVDRMVTDREEVFGILGVRRRTEAAPEETQPRGRRQVTGEFKRPFLIPFDGEIDDTLAASVRRRVGEAEAAGADLIVFEVDSPGGLVSASMEIGDFIFALRIPTVMLILKEAYSGAALVSLAGDEIVMSPNGVLGDCQPISIRPGGYDVVGEKIQSPLRAVFRKYAEANGYPIVLAESMVTQEMVVVRATFADGTVLYLEPEKVAAQEQAHGKSVRVEEIVKKDQLLTMHGAEARDFGFTGELVESRAQALARFGLSEAQVTVLEESWSEGFSRFLLGIKFLLFLVGLIAAWMEIKAPGFGLPGAIAIIAFGLFFAASWIAGITSGLEIVLFVLGIALLAVEVFLLPGFGVPGILGFVLIVSSLYMASVKYGLPSGDRPWEMEGFLDWLLSFGGTMVAVLAGAVVVAKILPATSIGRRLILAPSGPEGSLGLTGSASVEGERTRDLAGRRGRALSTLRPAGRIEVDGEPYNAVTEGDWIDPGDEIEVQAVRANQIVVRKA